MLAIPLVIGVILISGMAMTIENLGFNVAGTNSEKERKPLTAVTIGNWNLSIERQEQQREPPNFSTYLYFSVVTFTTLGFGDITPKTHISEIWLMAEVILGYVMLGGLISIFANKLARRS